MTVPSRGARWQAPILWGLVAFAVAALAVAVVGFSNLADFGYDLEAYLDAAARLAAYGSPYQAETLDGPFRPGPYGLYLYAPPLAVAMLPFADADPDLVALGWAVLRIATIGTACAIIPVRPAIRLVAFAMTALSAPALHDLSVGNVSTLLLLPMAAMWRWLDRPAGSVALALAGSLRPSLGLFVVWWLLRRQLKPIAWTAIASLALVVVTLPFVGLQGYIDYLSVLRNVSDAMGVRNNVDLGTVALGIGWSHEAATLLLAFGHVLALGALLAAVRRDRETGFIVTLMASLLLMPLLWPHYAVAFVFPAAFMAQRGRSWAFVLLPLTWLPVTVYPFLAVAATVMPFAAPAPKPEQPEPDRPSPVVAPPPAERLNEGLPSA
jgi:hypothetical protein